MAFSQRTLDLLQEVGLLGYKPMQTLIDADTDLWDESRLILEDVTQYRRLVGKRVYLTVTRPDITYVVGSVSQFMHKSKKVHWKAALRIQTYIKRSFGKGLLYRRMGICGLTSFLIPVMQEIGELLYLY